MLSDKNEKNDNKFLNILSDIDDDLIQSAFDDSVEPEIITLPGKRHRFMQIFVPAAASLALIASVGIGALIIGNNLTSPTGGNTEITVVNPVTSSYEQSTSPSDNETASTSQDDSETAPTDTQSAQTDTTETIPPPIGSSPRPLSEVNIPNINGYSANFDLPHDDIVQSVILDTKKYGDYEAVLVGHGVFTDYEYASENIIFAHSLDIHLYKNGEFIDLRSAYNPLDPNASVYMLMKDHLDSYLELIDADETNIDDFLIIFRSLNGSRPIPEVLFYFVSEGKLFDCKREDLGSNENRADRSEALSPDVYMVLNGVSAPVEYTLYDNLTGKAYTFNMINTEWCSYREGRREYSWNEDGVYLKFDQNTIPVIEEFTYDEVKSIRSQLTPPTIISEKTVGEYTLSLMGMNMRMSSNGTIYFYNPQTVVTKNGEYICSVNTTFAEMIPYHASIMYSNNGNYDGYAAEACIMNNVLLIIDKNKINDSYFGSYDCFYAYNGDGNYAYSLLGYYPNMPGTDPPAWTTDRDGYDLIIDEENQTVIYGFMKFEFNFEALPAMHNYTVSWLEEPLY